MPQRVSATLLAAIALGLPAFFVLFPILSFVLTSVWRLSGGQIVQEFTFENYLAFFTTNGFLEVYGSTILLCLEVTALNVAIAVLVSIFMVRRSASTRLGMLMLLTLPLFMSYIIKIYAIRGLLGQRGLLNEALVGIGMINEPLGFLLFNRAAIFLTLVVVYIPYAILPIYLSMERIPANVLEASSDLGGNLVDEIFRIVLPLSAPGVIAAVLFSFVMTLGDFITPQMVGGTEGFTFGRIVYSQFGLALNWPLGAALAVILLVTALMAAGLACLFLRRRGMP